jgi:nicotinamide-nucleotide adenylyltransferase
MIALFIGRFQPFHRGHLWAVKRCLKSADKVIIAIGSSQTSRTATNPFTAPERREMIDATLKAEHITGYAIFEVPDMPGGHYPDINGDHDWVTHIQKIIPRFDVVYTGNSLGKELFSDAGYEVVDLPRYKNISGSEIRLRMQKGLDWKTLVPLKVAQMIRLIGPGPHAASRKSLS